MVNKGLRLVLAAGLSLTLAACTGGGGTPAPAPESGEAGGALSGEITFQTWSLKNDRFTPYFESVIDAFETEHPDVTVNWMDQPGDGYEDKILQQANSNTLPDVINLPPEFAYKLAQVDQLTDLRAADAATVDLYVPGAVTAYEYPEIEGVYAYPWYLGTDLNFWNMELLGKAGITEADLPTTIDGIFELASKVAKETNGEVKIISESPKMGTLNNAGVELIKDGQFAFNTPDAVALIDKYHQAFLDGALPAEALSGNYLGNSALFKQGKVAYTTASAGFASELEKEAPTLLANTVATARIGNPPLFVQGISVAKTSKNPTVALEFAKFVTNNDNQIEFLKIAQGFFPGTQAANDNPESFTSVIENALQKDATEKAASSIKNAKPEYPIQFTYAMDTYFKQQVALAVRGDISSQEALDKALQNANDSME
ncbi:MAG: extracellular solute-binding protein [Propionibacteriaceae bacterium]|nr:extracellular solute-binding protein [Propionibacteriaceae bacterium]